MSTFAVISLLVGCLQAQFVPDCHDVCPDAFCLSAKAAGSCNNRNMPDHEGLKIAMIYCPVTCGFCTQPPNTPLPPSDPMWNTRCPKEYQKGGPPLP